MQLYSILNLADSEDFCRNTVSHVLSYVSSTYSTCSIHRYQSAAFLYYKIYLFVLSVLTAMMYGRSRCIGKFCSIYVNSVALWIFTVLVQGKVSSCCFMITCFSITITIMQLVYIPRWIFAAVVQFDLQREHLCTSCHARLHKILGAFGWAPSYNIWMSVVRLDTTR
jgi:hypothetical protein